MQNSIVKLASQIILRPYQEDLIEKTRLSLRQGHRAPLLVSPCGSGKTVMFSYLAKHAAAKGNRVLILAHREELLDQISETLLAFGVQHGFIAAKRPFNPAYTIQVASVFSVVRRLDKISSPEMIIIDEAHHSSAGCWKKIFEAFPLAYKIGVTASPRRLSGEPLGEIFDDLVLGPSIADLVSQGALCDYKLYIPSKIDLSGVSTRYGDYSSKDLSEAVDKPKITGDVVLHYKKFAHNKRAIVFCVSIEHAKNVAAEFTLSGYSAGCIDGKMSPVLRGELVARFKSGEVQILTSCDLVSEGFNLPAIEVAIFLRPTKSLALWIQQSGRALRPLHGKSHAILLDHVGNCMRHGLPDDVHEWSLEGKKKKPKEPSLKTCESCLAVNPTHASRCRACGKPFGSAKPRGFASEDGELKEATKEEIRKKRLTEQAQAQDIESLIALGKSRNYRFPVQWAKHVLRTRAKNRGK